MTRAVVLLQGLPHSRAGAFPPGYLLPYKDQLMVILREVHCTYNSSDMTEATSSLSGFESANSERSMDKNT